MNLRQRITAFTGLLVEAGMLLYPPWIMPGWRDDTYRFIFFPPQYATPRYVVSFSDIQNGVIDVQRLTFQCVIVAILTIAVILVLGTKKSSD